MITFSEIATEPLILIIQFIIVAVGAIIFPTRWEITSKFKKQEDHDEDIKQMKTHHKENLEEVKTDIKEHISLRMDTLNARFDTVGAILDAIKEKG